MVVPLDQSKLPSPKIRRIRTMALETFKILNKSSPEFIQNIITIKENPYNFRYQNTVDVPRPRTTRYDKNSFSYETATLELLTKPCKESFNFWAVNFFFISDWYFSEKLYL